MALKMRAPKSTCSGEANSLMHRKMFKLLTLRVFTRQCVLLAVVGAVFSRLSNCAATEMDIVGSNATLRDPANIRRSAVGSRVDLMGLRLNTAQRWPRHLIKTDSHARPDRQYTRHASLQTEQSDRAGRDRCAGVHNADISSRN